MKYLCSYVLALANNIYRAEARLPAGYKPAPRVDDKLQFTHTIRYKPNIMSSFFTIFSLSGYIVVLLTPNKDAFGAT